MFTSTIGVDGPVKTQIRALIVTQRGLGVVLGQAGWQRRQFREALLKRRPTIIKGLPPRGFKAHRRVGDRPAPLAGKGWHGKALRAAIARGQVGDTIGHEMLPFPILDILTGRVD